MPRAEKKNGIFIDTQRRKLQLVFKQKIARASPQEFENWIKKRSLQVVGASPNGLQDYDKIHYQSPTILFLGNERKGLSEKEKTLCNQLVRIPMVAGIDSLNVAVAGSLLLYEVFRGLRKREDCG